MTTNTSSLDFGITPMARYQYVHLYLEAATRPGMGPAWRGMTWLAVPIGQ